MDNVIGNNGLSEPKNARDAKLLAPVIFMLGGMEPLHCGSREKMKG
jgi:hypothetical protein